MTKLGKGLIQAVKEARAIARGEADPDSYHVHFAGPPEDLVFDIEAEDEEQAAAIAELLLTCDSEEEAVAMLEDLNRRMIRH